MLDNPSGKILISLFQKPLVAYSSSLGVEPCESSPIPTGMWTGVAVVQQDLDR